MKFQEDQVWLDRQGNHCLIVDVFPGFVMYENTTQGFYCFVDDDGYAEDKDRPNPLDLVEELRG